MNEPHMAPWWFPANDHPPDKALIDIRSPCRAASRSSPTAAWSRDTPAATGRRTAGSPTSRWRRTSRSSRRAGSRSAAGRPTACPGSSPSPGSGTPAERSGCGRCSQRTPEIVSWLASRLGDYPFAQTGGVVTALDARLLAGEPDQADLPLRRPRGSERCWCTSWRTSGSATRCRSRGWRDIWLNEGFASFMDGCTTRTTAAGPPRSTSSRAYDTYPASSEFWKRGVLDPGPDLVDLFGGAVYERGAMTLQALRNRIGDEAFWTVLRTWVADHRHGNGTTAEFDRPRRAGQRPGPRRVLRGLAGDARTAGPDGRQRSVVSRASRYGRPARAAGPPAGAGARGCPPRRAPARRHDGRARGGAGGPR